MPQFGGSIGAWYVAGQAMLRSAAPGASDPLAMACFPLVPYAGRIANGRFVWGQRPVRLPVNLPETDHAIHGCGFQSVWIGERVSKAAAVMRLVHRGDARWPWPFVAEQHVSLADGALTLTMTATNLADHPQQLSLSLHPYFDSAGARLRFSATRFWLNTADRLPGDPAPVPPTYRFADGAELSCFGADNALAGWDGCARIDWAGRPLGLDINACAALPVVQLYVPADAPFFCFEPIAHLPNAINRLDDAPAMPVVSPGEAFQATLRLAAVSRHHSQSRENRSIALDCEKPPR